jgi:hypothetical protein
MQGGKIGDLRKFKGRRNQAEKRPRRLENRRQSRPGAGYHCL